MNFNSSEEEYRYNVFKSNYEFIEEENAKNSGLTLGLTAFAAMTNEEYREKMLRKR